jgi:hypothetical protein
MELSAKARAANSSDLKPFFLNLATVVLARNVTTALSNDNDENKRKQGEKESNLCN